MTHTNRGHRHGTAHSERKGMSNKFQTITGKAAPFKGKSGSKIRRNAKCYCGSGIKFKKCCGATK